MTAVECTLSEMGRSGGGVSRYVYRGRVRYRARLYLNGEEQSLGVYDTHEEAEAVAEEAARIAGVELKLPGVNILRRYGQDWLDAREKAGHVRGMRQERSVWKTHVRAAPFADQPIKTITHAQIYAWASGLMDTRSRQTAQHALRVLRSCLTEALNEGLIGENPAARVKLPNGVGRKEDSAEAWTYLEPSEIESLLTYDAAPHWARDIWAVAIYTGLRKGELAGLRWCDVHTDGAHPRLVVVRSYKGPTKSGKGREVPLLPPALEALRRVKKRTPGVGKAPVWPSATKGVWGEYWDPGGWTRYALGRTRPVAGCALDRHVRFHDLRHTCASHLVQGTWLREPLSLYRVKQWMGHSAISVTERYAHLAPGGLRSAAEQWDPTDRPANRPANRQQKEES